MAEPTNFKGTIEGLPDAGANNTSLTDYLLNLYDTARDIQTKNPGLDQSKYDFNYRVFPEDLGSDYNNHYMMININVPVNSKENVRGSYYNAVGPAGSVRSTVLPGEFSNVDNLRFNRDSGVISGTEGNADLREAYALRRGTRRIAESIALYMPTPMIYTAANIYEEVSMTSIAAQIGKLAALPIGEAIGAAASAFTRRSIQAGRQGAGAAGSLIDAAGNIIGTGFALAGYPINPRIEVLFSNTVQRQFNFEFLMAPRNQKESDTIKNIIRTLRFHSAPEIDTVARIIPTFIPPADFDISFYSGGVENLNIPRINTCVLERCEVDYSPTGVWSTFSNGQPVAVRLSLGFREVELVHKRRVVQGF